ncbi:ANTAR domain-containing response regulator [Photobacterium leiognathi]|uniref:ANTAR domain-containing response regulator n=1 Tax=Photobacterium leiognathi TaxID=553611 RepID=UPI0029811C7C|nr:ANTAR domain-containing protein [Photobacterium leiognathi]
MPVIPIIVCSDNPSEQSKIARCVAFDQEHVIESSYEQLERCLESYPTATVITSWLTPCAELRAIIKISSSKSVPLIVFIRKFNLNTFNNLPDPDGYLLLPSSVDCDFNTWVNRAKQVREKQIELTSEIAHLEQKLEDKKWVDKAKGLLQKFHNLSEEQAYGMLRKAAMDQSLSIAQVSANLIAALQKSEQS